MRLTIIWAVVLLARLATAAPVLTTVQPKEVSKREATLTALKGGKVFKCQELELTDKVTFKAKSQDKEQE